MLTFFELNADNFTIAGSSPEPTYSLVTFHVNLDNPPYFANRYQLANLFCIIFKSYIANILLVVQI